MEKVKILEVVPSLQEGGIEHFLYNYLSNINLNNFDIEILTQNPRYYESERKFKDLNIKIISIPSKKQNFLKYFISAYKIMKENKYNIVHCHLSAKSFWILYIAKFAGIKNRFCHSHEAPQYTGLKKYLYKFYAILSRKSSTCYLACGMKAANFVFGNNSNVIIIPNSINSDRFIFNDKARNLIRSKYNISDNSFCICNIGRLNKLKNQKFLIYLIEKIKINIPNVVLLIVGDGPLKDDLYDFTNKMNLINNVYFTGNVSNPWDYYSASDCFVLPSISEGFPVSGIEAQASGLPCYFSTNITKEVDIIDCKYYSLDNINEWEKVIETKVSNEQRIIRNNIIKNSIYDISNGVKILEDIYKKGGSNE